MFHNIKNRKGAGIRNISVMFKNVIVLAISPTVGLILSFSKTISNVITVRK